MTFRHFDEPMDLTFYAPPRPPTADEIIAGTPHEPCECCGTLVTVVTVQFSDEDVTIVAELIKLDEWSVKVQQHGSDRCRTIPHKEDDS